MGIAFSDAEMRSARAGEGTRRPYVGTLRLMPDEPRLICP